MRILAYLSLVLLTACGGGGGSVSAPTPQPVDAKALPTVSVPACSTSVTASCEWAGDISTQPVVVALGLSAHDTLTNTAALGTLIPQLQAAGYAVLSLDLPCHGADAVNLPVAPPGESPNLLCWAQRIAAGDDSIFLKFCAQLRDAMDGLGIERAEIVGVSRGGYVAITCASFDARFVAIALEAPVTDLNYLSEFKAQPVNGQLFNTEQYIRYLNWRPVLVRIGYDDTRVGTSLAEGFAEKVGAQLQVLNCVGHCAPEDGTTIKFFEQYTSE